MYEVFARLAGNASMSCILCQTQTSLVHHKKIYVSSVPCVVCFHELSSTEIVNMTLVSQIKSAALFACSFTYFGALLHYTLDPIAELERCQSSVEETQILLQNIRVLKIEELELVKKAVRRPSYCLEQCSRIRR